MLFLEDGYAAMKLLDNDDDGMLIGSELEGLALWRDEDQDGTSEPGEILSLSERHIIGLATEALHRENGVLTNPQGVHYSDGSTSPSYDVILNEVVTP